MEEIRGTCQFPLFFNSEKGLSAFILKPEDGTCLEYLGENGMVKAVGMFCLQQKKLPVVLEGEWVNTEYGPEFHLDSAELRSCSLRDSEGFLAAPGIAIKSKDIKKILDVTGQDIFCAAGTPGIEDLVCQSPGVDSVAVIQAFSKIRSLMKEHELFDFLDKYGGLIRIARRS